MNNLIFSKIILNATEKLTDAFIERPYVDIFYVRKQGISERL